MPKRKLPEIHAVDRLIRAPERLGVIESHLGKIIAVNRNAPVGYVMVSDPEAGYGWFGTLIITMLGEEKVAITIPYTAYDPLPQYKILNSEVVAYGLWGPFSDIERDGGIVAHGDELDMLRKRRSGWSIKCQGPDGEMARVPIPRRWADADKGTIRRSLLQGWGLIESYANS